MAAPRKEAVLQLHDDVPLWSAGDREEALDMGRRQTSNDREVWLAQLEAVRAGGKEDEECNSATAGGEAM